VKHLLRFHDIRGGSFGYDKKLAEAHGFLVMLGIFFEYATLLRPAIKILEPRRPVL
jgi:hypothetical protein